MESRKSEKWEQIRDQAIKIYQIMLSKWQLSSLIVAYHYIINKYLD